MKKIWIITIIVILILVTSILVFIIVDQYTKYALKVATIELVKEYCNEDITVREVRINRFPLMTSGISWRVDTDPPQFSKAGEVTRDGYKTFSPSCFEGSSITFKLNRLKREFVPLNK